MDGLTPGRIVHFVGYDYAEKYEGNQICMAAIVTAVTAPKVGTANLHVFDLDGEGGSGQTSDYSETHEEFTWHWPERA